MKKRAKFDISKEIIIFLLNIEQIAPICRFYWWLFDAAAHVWNGKKPLLVCVSSLKWRKLISSLLQFIFSIVTVAAVLKAKPRLNWSLLFIICLVEKWCGWLYSSSKKAHWGGWGVGASGRSIYRRSIFWKQRPRISPSTCLVRVRAPLIQMIREMRVFVGFGA